MRENSDYSFRGYAEVALGSPTPASPFQARGQPIAPVTPVRAQAPHENVISVILDSFASDLGGRLDAVEKHVIERSCKMEQMLNEMDKRWESIRQASSSMPGMMEMLEQSVQGQMDRLRFTVEGTYVQVEQLVSGHPPLQRDATGHSAATPSLSDLKSEAKSEAPSFGGGMPVHSDAPTFGHGSQQQALHHDELDAIMVSKHEMHEADHELIGHVERHLQMIHGQLEEMTLQHHNLHIKINTVHNKINDTNAPPQRERAESDKIQLGYKSNSPKKKDLALLPVKAVELKEILPTLIAPCPGAKELEKCPVEAKEPKDGQSNGAGSDRLALVHALHGAMGLRVRQLHPHHPAHPWREKWQWLANHRWFTFLSMSSIILNGFLTGVEADIEVRYILSSTLFNEGVALDKPDVSSKHVFRLITCVLIVFWISELIINALAQGSEGFFSFRNPMFKWNLFDIACVVLSVLDLMADTLVAIKSIPGLGFLRILRVARLLRVLRAIRTIRAFQGVRKLVIAVQGALLTLFWALILLALLLYVFTIMISSGVSHHYEGLGPEGGEKTNNPNIPEGKSHTQMVQFFYGGVFQTMATLFQAITGGDWTVMAEYVFEISWQFYAIWYGYIAFVLFGLLNVFTGIFVESATHAANADREIRIQAQMEEESSYVNQLRTIFERSDTDHSMCMTEGELAKLMDEDDFNTQLECLGIHPTEAHGLFKLLDDDDSGSVTIEEFLSGCIRLKGTAKAIDMITLLFETNKISKKIGKLTRIVQELQGPDQGPDESVALKDSDDPALSTTSSRDGAPAPVARSMSVTSF